MNAVEPKLVCFSCQFGWGYVADQQKLAATIPHWVPVICSGKVDVESVMHAFRAGADGILILGCPEGQCHFQDGNYQLKKRLTLLQQVMEQFGIDRRRLRTVFAFDPEGTSMPQRYNDMIIELWQMPPLELNTKGSVHG